MIEPSEESASLRAGNYYITADATYIDDRTHVLNHCDTFGIISRSGDILPLGKEVQGIYHRDTRYINCLELRINGIKPTLLSSNIKEENEILSVDLTNPDMQPEHGGLHQGTLHLHRSQFVRDGVFHEKIELINYNEHPHHLVLSIRFGSDFKDIFEVRGLKRAKRGEFMGYEFPDPQTIHMTYRGLDKVNRVCRITFGNGTYQPEDRQTGSVKFDLDLPPGQTVLLDYAISFEEGNETTSHRDYQTARTRIGPEMEKTKSYFPVIETSNEQFTHWIHRSKADLVSLMADTPFGKYPYAGVPWYNTAFGRDGLITALETLWIAPALSRDVLRYLAGNQATTINHTVDAEPGKILHETRGGEMVALNEVPFRQYYGTIDATPLFVMLAGEYYNRTADLGTIKQIWPNIVQAINWIDEYGDLDGDGFVEYQHKSKNGLTNQGWKDSYDSVFYANGQLAGPPIALCEVQGYVYCAKMHSANLALLLGEKALAEKWRTEARILKEKFNDAFWDREMECYILALDGKKQPCRVKSSNAGQVLFTGIADPAKAKKLVSTLMKPDMFNGWGIRTLSSEERRYNPMSYHNGSIWPHDVALIAEGMGRYGYHQQAMQLMTGLFDASLFINLQRLPELFCGTDRRAGEGPTAYPVACSPQAWSVAAVFMLLKAILQVRIVPLKKQISFHKPTLPPYLDTLHIRNLEVGDMQIDLELIRHGRDNMVGVNWNYTGSDWELSVVK